MDRLERAQLASLTLLANDEISSELQEELLFNAGVYNVVLRRDEARQLILSAPLPSAISATFDLRDATPFQLIRDAILTISTPDQDIIRIIGEPSNMGGILIEITLDSAQLRDAMVDYGLRILLLSAVISVVTAVLLFLAVRGFLVKPIRRVVGHMSSYADAPEDARRIIAPTSTTTEIRQAEEALQSMQTQLTASLKQRERLALLGGAVAKINHDLRNILTSAQLFTDRIEMSEDPGVKRLAPKLVNSITRAVQLCESTLTYGKADELPTNLSEFTLINIVSDVMESERLAVMDADVSFAEDVPETLTITGDSEQFFRVISNLVRNARQAIVNTGQSGEIAVSAIETEDSWEIRVADNGPGLPLKARDHLFQPFQGGVTKGGTGLGLSIASDLIRGHGGKLELERSDDNGTVFLIRLPRGDTQLN